MIPDVARHRASLDRTVRCGVPGDPALLRRFGHLLDVVAGLDSCVLALSGGVDSCLLLQVASRLIGERCLAVTGDSEAVPVWDRSDATAAGGAAARHGARWRMVPTRELDDPRYADNPRSRCYFCKSEIYGTLDRIAREEGLRWVVDGTNATDMTATDRPGMAAADAIGVRSPLAEARLTKADVRTIARAIGMRGWDRPASACLSSRIPFGAAITPQRLRRVEAAELSVRALGYRQVRVRDLGERARVEVDAHEVPRLQADAARIDRALREVGFDRWSAGIYSGTGAGDRDDARS